MKSKTTALILSIFLGGIGVDRFYLGYTGMGVLKLLTVGCFGILYIIDIINIATGKLRPSDGSSYEEDSKEGYGTIQRQSSPYDDLEKLASLKDQGAITEEEFTRLKDDCLRRM